MTRPLFILCFFAVRMLLSPVFAMLPSGMPSSVTPVPIMADQALVSHKVGVPQTPQTIAVNAHQISDDLTRGGRAVFYNVLFDSEKTAVKPESVAQLGEIAKVLQSNPDLRVFITVHTDNLGMLDYNLRLSQRRAQAVVIALITHYGIDGRRLVPRGMGQLAPLTSNATPTGRVKNSRLEIVEMAPPASYSVNNVNPAEDPAA